jgi:chitin disaccharide deacetylase
VINNTSSTSKSVETELIRSLPTNHPRRMIINGDDFGFSNGVNQAIIKAHEEGVLTSTSLMVTGDAVEQAIDLARAHPHLGVGLHLVLVCGKSALSPKEIPDLVDVKGNFSDDPTKAGLRYQFHQATHKQLYREIRTQLEKFRATGLPLSHVDGHLHMHVHPVVMGILVDLAPEFGINFIRLPAEELSINLKLNNQELATKIIWSIVFGRLRRYSEKLLESKGIGFADKVYGLLQTGGMTEEYLLGLIPQISADFVEIYSHPAMMIDGESLNGTEGAGEAELAAYLSLQVRSVINECGFELCNFSSKQALNIL